MELKKKGHEARETFSELAFDVRKHVLPAFSKEYKELLGEAESREEARKLDRIARDRMKARRMLRTANYASRVAAGATLGQGVAYGLRIGGDQVGGMKNYWRIGTGWDAAEWTAAQLPATVQLGATLKGVEIALDASRMYFERRILKKAGYVADVVPTAMGMQYGQPLWSGLEVTQKTVDALANVHMIGSPQQIVYSLGNIIDGLVRYAFDAAIWWKGEVLQKGYEGVFGRLFGGRIRKGEEIMERTDKELREVLGAEKLERIRKEHG